MISGYMIRLAIAWLLFCWNLAVPALCANQASADETLRTAVDEVLAAGFPEESLSSSARAARIQPVLDRFMDLETITRRAVGPAWQQLALEEQKRAASAFARLVVRTYVSHLEGEVRPQVVFDPGVKTQPDRCEIATRVTYDGRVFRVSYRLHQQSERWRIYDIVIEGVSFISNYRAQFAAIAQKGGGKAILRTLEGKPGQTK